MFETYSHKKQKRLVCGKIETKKGETEIMTVKLNDLQDKKDEEKKQEDVPQPPDKEIKPPVEEPPEENDKAPVDENPNAPKQIV